MTTTDDENKYIKGRWRYRRSVRKIDSDIFCMLSGGLDSFIGAINLLKDGEKPIFVSHYGGGKGVKIYQDKVINSLKTQYSIDSKRFFRFMQLLRVVLRTRHVLDRLCSLLMP